MNLLREPDAGDPHVRFDERDVETEQGRATQAPTTERVGNTLRSTYTTAPRLDSTNRRHRRRGVWQRKFWEHTIRDEGDFGRHFDYIHFNPVRHELVTCPHQWPHSSFRQWVKKGAYEWSWNCGCGRRRARGPSFDAIAKTARE